jgi:hypothetical protein
MKKIPTLFKRDFDQPRHPITPEYNDGVEWVLNGEGTATRKYDGMCAMVRDHRLYKRCEVKGGRPTPPDFELVATDPDTGKSYGWVQVGWGSEDKYFRDAISGGDPDKVEMPQGTYELVGPKVQGNPENRPNHMLVKHSRATVLFPTPPTEFESLKNYLADHDIEGIVWHHPDGRMVKIKKKDFGLKRS